MVIYKNKLILLIFILKEISAHANNAEKFQIVVPENNYYSATATQQNKTIDKLVEEQTDLIRRIVSSQKDFATPERPILLTNNKEIDDLKIKREKERLSIEELRRRCQELFKLSMQNNLTELNENQHFKEISTVEAFGPNRKPEFLQKTTKIDKEVSSTLKPIINLPSNITTHQVEQATKKYFFITRNQTTLTNRTATINNVHTDENSKKDNINVNLPESKTIVSLNNLRLQEQTSHPNIKYMHLEPVILQKMILNNGRMVFYWHKSIPAIPQLISVPNSSTLQQQQIQQYSYSYKQPQENYSATTNEEKIQTSQTSSSSSTSDVLPKYEIEYGNTERTDDNLYRKQLKFVIPIPYPPQREDSEAPRHFPGQFDPYAYYPKLLQPTTVNVPMPYMPTFHMIRTIRVPDNVNNFENKQK